MFRVESALWLSQERMLFTVGIKLYSKRRHVSIDLTVSKAETLILSSQNVHYINYDSYNVFGRMDGAFRRCLDDKNEPRLISHLISLKHARIIGGG